MTPPPRVFVGVSMYWVIAAKRAWPETPVVYVLPCLLSNCLPFTWPVGAAPSLWRRLDFAGIRRAEHRALAVADLTLTPTRAASEEVRAFHGALRPMATCTYGCAPLGRATEHGSEIRRTLGIGEDAFLVLGAGVMDVNKAFNHAVREIAKLNERAHLVLLGDGPERTKLEDLANRLGLDGRVHFAGVQREPGPWYAAADCVVSTSYYDTFPNVILEAMHCGRPVVVPQHQPPDVYAGMAEIVAEHGGGRTYARLTQGALARALEELMDRPLKRRELGRQAAEVAGRLFRWDGCLERILRVTR